MSNFYAATSLIGGGFGTLDAIDGAELADDDGAVVITADTAYFYHLNATSGEEESSPDIIVPDNNPGDKRWILTNVFGVDNFLSLIDTPADYTDQAGKYTKVNAGEDGLEFDTPSVTAGFSSRCSVYLSSNQSIPEVIITKVELDGEKYDDDDEFASYKFTAKKAGYYHVVVLARMNTGTGYYYQLSVKRNNVEINNFTRLITGDGSASIGKDVYLEINDYLELFIFQDDVQARNIRGVANGHLTYMSIHRFA